MDGTIIPYDKTVYLGDLDYNNGYVKGMTEYVMKLFLNAPPNHFIGTLLYFYHYEPELENPITVSAYGETITTHPGQGRLLSCYFRGHETIKSLLVPLNDTAEEKQFLHTVAKNVEENSVYKIFEYDNQNHHGISTEEFKEYFYPTDVRLSYESDKDSLLKDLIRTHGRIVWHFSNRESIEVGKQKFGNVSINCKTEEGFYHSLFYLAFGHFKKSKTYSLEKF